MPGRGPLAAASSVLAVLLLVGTARADPSGGSLFELEPLVPRLEFPSPPSAPFDVSGQPTLTAQPSRARTDTDEAAARARRANSQPCERAALRSAFLGQCRPAEHLSARARRRFLALAGAGLQRSRSSSRPLESSARGGGPVRHQLGDLAVRLAELAARDLLRHSRDDRPKFQNGLRLRRQQLSDQLLRPPVSRIDVHGLGSRRGLELLGGPAVPVAWQLPVGVHRRTPSARAERLDCHVLGRYRDRRGDVSPRKRGLRRQLVRCAPPME